ncbi:RluA family pseudouridine synthase [Mangrovitalea sediminis]|uniref:RluA family pseudouridine synthase n=1 Tax=Mangrovitalea sediminis TaxID=1982043 RepID=UPI000BE61763|nr:RluA family pseudouridine synthase [Mangrovitalea sediminis]
MAERVRIDGKWQVTEQVGALDILAERTGLPRQRIKDAMAKGAVWLIQRGRQRRLRRVRHLLQAGDSVAIYYDSQVLQASVPAPVLVADRGNFSVWDKPPGMLSQGSPYGDHLSLLRWLESAGFPKRQHFLVHRLDREASGVMVVAHQRGVAADLSAQLQARTTEKGYQVEVRLDDDRRSQLASGEVWTLDAPLDGKAAVTRVMLAQPAGDGLPDLLDIRIETGRKHQIRRHLAGAGYPVLGDPRYSNAQTRAPGLRLRAVSLAFRAPGEGDELRFTVAGLRDQAPL